MLKGYRPDRLSFRRKTVGASAALTSRKMTIHPHYVIFVTARVLVERGLSGEMVPEPLAIAAAQSLNFREISDLIRTARAPSESSLGGFSGMTWIRHIPGFLLKAFVRLADRNIRLAMRYGKVAVTAVGMFSRQPVWFVHRICWLWGSCHLLL